MFLHSLERRSQERRSYWARAPSDCLDSFPGGIISRLPCPFDIPKEGARNDGAAAHTLNLDSCRSFAFLEALRRSPCRRRWRLLFDSAIRQFGSRVWGSRRFFDN